MDVIGDENFVIDLGVVVEGVLMVSEDHLELHSLLPVSLAVLLDSFLNTTIISQHSISLTIFILC